MSPASTIPREEDDKGPQAPQIVICEQDGHWATRLMQICPELPRIARLRETRSLAECTVTLRSAPGSLVILEVHPDLPDAPSSLEASVRYLVGLHRRDPQSRAIIVGGRDLIPWERLFREVGALEVVVSPRELHTIVPLARRHLASLPAPVVGWRQRLWSSLPWS